MPAPDGPTPLPNPPSTPLGVVVYGEVVVGVVEDGGVVVTGVLVGVLVDGVVVDGVVVDGVVLVLAALALEGKTQPVTLGSVVEIEAVPAKSQVP